MLIAHLVERLGHGLDARLELEQRVALGCMRIGSVISPGFSFVSTSASVGDRSLTTMPEMRPPLAFDPDSEISPTSLAKSSPFSARSRAAVDLGFRPSSSRRHNR